MEGSGVSFPVTSNDIEAVTSVVVASPYATPPGGANQQQQPQNPVVQAPTTLAQLLNNAFALIISFLTGSYITFFIGDQINFELLAIFVALMVIAFLWYDIIKTVINLVDRTDAQWNGAVGSFLDFVTYTLIFIVFQYGPKMVLEYQNRIGLTLGEKVFLAVINLLILFVIYEFFTYVGKHEKEWNDNHHQLLKRVRARRRKMLKDKEESFLAHSPNRPPPADQMGAPHHHYIVPRNNGDDMVNIPSSM